MLNKLSLPGPDSKFQAPEGQPAGFWAGVWHGCITPLSFLISLFKPGVRLYENHNVGRWYDFGYIIGLSIAFGPKRQVVIKTGDHPSDEDKDEE